jgi:hypothetical protein
MVREVDFGLGKPPLRWSAPFSADGLRLLHRSFQSFAPPTGGRVEAMQLNLVPLVRVLHFWRHVYEVFQ